VVETVPVNARAGEHLLYTVTPGMIADPGGVPALSAEESEVFCALLEHVVQLRHPRPGQRKRHTKDEERVVASFEQAMKAVLQRLPSEEVLRKYAPEQRLQGLTPEQLAATIDALPAEVREQLKGRLH
jgi:hypothetical protein